MNLLPQSTHQESARRIVLSRLENVLSNLLFYVRRPSQDALSLEWRDSMLDAINRVFTTAIESEYKHGNQAFSGILRRMNIKARELVHVLTENPAVSTSPVEGWVSILNRDLFSSLEELVQELQTLSVVPAGQRRNEDLITPAAVNHSDANGSPVPFDEERTPDTTVGSSGDTRRFFEAANRIRCELAKSLFIAQCNGQLEGKSIEDINLEFRETHRKKLGKTAAEQKSKMDAMIRTAQRHRKGLNPID